MGSYLSYTDALTDRASMIEYLRELHEELAACSSEATARVIRERIAEAHDYFAKAAALIEKRH